MNDHCYLCGLEIKTPGASGDHVVPAHLIERDQPRVKGFDYGGKLRTHEECNNRFGPETYSVKALDLLAALNDEECIQKVQNVKDPSILMLAVNSACLPDFTARDLAYFRFIDVRDKEQGEWSDPSFYQGKPRSDATQAARDVAFSVLAKSAAALLIKRHVEKIPDHWNIYAAAYTGAVDQLDFDGLLGEVQPFDIGVKVWIRQFDTGEWLAVYRARKVMVIFVFSFSEDSAARRLSRTFGDVTDVVVFRGANLNELVSFRWAKV